MDSGWTMFVSCDVNQSICPSDLRLAGDAEVALDDVRRQKPRLWTWHLFIELEKKWWTNRPSQWPNQMLLHNSCPTHDSNIAGFRDFWSRLLELLRLLTQRPAVERLNEDRALRRNLCVSLTGLVCRGCKFNPGLCSEVVEVLFRFQRYHSRSDRPEMYHSQWDLPHPKLMWFTVCRWTACQFKK